jgi:hypothetical protein
MRGVCPLCLHWQSLRFTDHLRCFQASFKPISLHVNQRCLIHAVSTRDATYPTSAEGGAFLSPKVPSFACLARVALGGSTALEEYGTSPLGLAPASIGGLAEASYVELRVGGSASDGASYLYQ